MGAWLPRFGRVRSRRAGCGDEQDVWKLCGWRTASEGRPYKGEEEPKRAEQAPPLEMQTDAVVSGRGLRQDGRPRDATRLAVCCWSVAAILKYWRALAECCSDAWYSCLSAAGWCSSCWTEQCWAGWYSSWYLVRSSYWACL